MVGHRPKANPSCYQDPKFPSLNDFLHKVSLCLPCSDHVKIIIMHPTYLKSFYLTKIQLHIWQFISDIFKMYLFVYVRILAGQVKLWPAIRQPSFGEFTTTSMLGDFGLSELTLLFPGLALCVFKPQWIYFTDERATFNKYCKCVHLWLGRENSESYFMFVEYNRSTLCLKRFWMLDKARLKHKW